MRERSLAAPTLVVVLAIAFCVHRLEDFDTWYHLAAGRLMLATHTWPATNTFSLTAPNYPWIDLHWIFQLVLYGAWSMFGIAGTTLLAAAVMAATALVLFGVAQRSVPPMLAAFLVAVALVISSPRFVPRPELMSFLYFATYLAILEGLRTNGRAVWLLVPLQILWVNTQGIFAVGLALIGCYWLGATLAFLPFLPRGWREASGLDVATWRRLTLVTALATLSCLVNPWGLDGALFPIQLLPRVTGSSLFSSRIGEFRPPLESGYAPVLVRTWLVVLVAAGLSFFANLRRWHLGRLIAVAAFGFLSTQSLRNMAFFGWMAVPVLAGNLGPLAARWQSPWLRRALAAVTAAAIVVLVGAIATNRFSKLMNTEREFGLGVSTVRFPEDAVAFLERAGIAGRAFNCLAMGGYLTWTRPRDAVYVDGRLEAFPEAIFRDYFRAMDDPSTFPSATRAYALDYALLYHAWGNRTALVNYLAKDHGWTLVYFDEIATIFVPSDEAHRAMRERALAAFDEVRAERQRRPEIEPPSSLARSLTVPVGETWRQSAYGNLLRVLGRADEAVGAYKRSLALDPEQNDTRVSLGFAYWAGNQREAAIREWREVLRRDPSDDRVKQILARATGAH